MKKLLATTLIAFGLFSAMGSPSAEAQASDPTLGQLMTVGFNFCPRGWALAEGQLLPIPRNEALFSLLGCQFGGDCRTTFALPDLRGRTVVGSGQGPGLDMIDWGQRGGQTETTLTQATLPSHTHTAQLKASSSPANTTTAASAALASAETYATRSVPEQVMSDSSVVVGNTGGQIPFNIRNPYLGMYVCISLQGNYPSRN